MIVSLKFPRVPFLSKLCQYQSLDQKIVNRMHEQTGARKGRKNERPTHYDIKEERLELEQLEGGFWKALRGQLKTSYTCEYKR